MAEKAAFKRRRTWLHPRFLLRSLLRNWPVAVWLALIVVVALLYSRGAQFGEMIGVIETIEEPVAPLETARLQEIHVQVGHRVRRGDPLAQMDTSLIEAEMAVRQAELLEAQETITGYQQNILNLVRQFGTSVGDAEASLQGTLLDQQRDAAQLAALKAELQRLEGLLAKRLVSEQDVSALRPQIAALERAVAGYPALIEIQTRRVTEAREERDNVMMWLRATEGEDPTQMIRVKMQARNAIIAANRDMLQKRKDAYVLKATRDGVVSQILEQPGNVINAGLPIMTLVTERPDHVIGFLPEVHLAELEAGDKVRVWRQTGGPGRGVAAVVESISPDVQGLPTRINPIRGQILRGRRVMVRFAEAHDFVPGETVEIREVKAGWGATFVDVWSRLFR